MPLTDKTIRRLVTEDRELATTISAILEEEADDSLERAEAFAVVHFDGVDERRREAQLHAAWLRDVVNRIDAELERTR